MLSPEVPGNVSAGCRSCCAAERAGSGADLAAGDPTAIAACLVEDALEWLDGDDAGVEVPLAMGASCAVGVSKPRGEVVRSDI